NGRARPDQLLQQRDRWRFAHVVRTRLEREPPDGEPQSPQIAAKVARDLLEQYASLRLVATLDRLQHHRLDVDGGRHVNQRTHILRKARAAVAHTGIDEGVAYARVGTDADAHVLDVHAQPVAQVRDLVHERDLGREHRVRRVLRELRVA